MCITFRIVDAFLQEESVYCVYPDHSFSALILPKRNIHDFLRNYLNYKFKV